MLKKMAERIKHHLHGSGTMTTQDIVKKSIERTDPSADWENVYTHLQVGVNSNKFRIFRCGDTLLFYKVETPIASELHIYSADPQDKLLHAIRQFGHSMVIAGFNKATTVVKDGTMIRLMRKAQSPHFVINSTPLPTGGYSVTMEAK